MKVSYAARRITGFLDHGREHKITRAPDGIKFYYKIPRRESARSLWLHVKKLFRDELSPVGRLIVVGRCRRTFWTLRSVCRDLRKIVTGVERDHPDAKISSAEIYCVWAEDADMVAALMNISDLVADYMVEHPKSELTRKIVKRLAEVEAE